MLKRLIFWDFPRTTWQYDLVVALILAFIFLTPRSIFKDQPRAPGVVRLPSAHGGGVFFVDSALLSSSTPESLLRQAGEAVSQRTGKQTAAARVQAVHDEDGELKGYMVYLKP